MSLIDYIDFSDEVKYAINSKIPIVGIETAGTFEAFSFPINYDLANTVMEKIRDAGAIPAYIAIVNGRIKVGLSEDDKVLLAKAKTSLIKASRRDIPILITKGMTALTSVASTMMIADAVGIKVVTGGGIGGVHRGAERTFDISADLNEFCKSNVIVVCSGAKSILDLKLTMEYLETKAVTIGGYRTHELPAYMAINSGCKLDYSFKNPGEIAKCYTIKEELGIPGSLLVANPIDEKYAVDSEKMNAAIEKAVKEADENGIVGKVITKYIMDIVKKEMGDDSVEASLHMNMDNAALAAQIACELFKN